MLQSNYTFKKSGDIPLVATAIHDGHKTRNSLSQLFNLNDSERLREEDPFTANWVKFCGNSIIVHHSRFETDINRPREKAIYVTPGDAWGLHVWKNDLEEEAISESLAVYDNFYREAKSYFDGLFSLHSHLVVYDIHSYNHRREGREIEASGDENPEVNIGTKNIDRKKWQPVITALIENFRSFDYNGRHLDVRENVKFKGGYFGQWLFETYGTRICPISIEFKKFFMDEWTGEPFEKDIQLVTRLVENSAIVVLDALKKINAHE